MLLRKPHFEYSNGHFAGLAHTEWFDLERPYAAFPIRVMAEYCDMPCLIAIEESNLSGHIRSLLLLLVG